MPRSQSFQARLKRVKITTTVIGSDMDDDEVEVRYGFTGPLDDEVNAEQSRSQTDQPLAESHFAEANLARSPSSFLAPSTFDDPLQPYRDHRVSPLLSTSMDRSEARSPRES